MKQAFPLRAPLAGILTLTLLAGSTRADVLVVHATNGPFTTIQAAIVAAQNGDTVLVKPGSYSAFLIDGKSLTLAGDSGPVLVSGACAVRNLGAGELVVVSGLTISVPVTWYSPPDYYTAGLTLVNNAGDVRVEACSLTGKSNTTWGGEGGAGAWIHGNAGSVAMVRCTLTGGRGSNEGDFNGGRPGGAGIDLENSRLALYDGTSTGGRGGDGFDGAGDGAHGVHVRISTMISGLFASNTRFQGGRGGDDWEDALDFLSDPGSGGNGLQLESGTAAHLVDNAYFGGARGVGIFCDPPVPPPAGVGLAGSGQAHTFPVMRVELVAPSVAREGTSVSLAVRAQPGEAVYLLSSRATGFAVMPSWRGALIPTLRNPAMSMILGTVPASGLLELTLPLPTLPSGIAARDTFVQVYRRDDLGTITLGSFAVVSVLDSAY